MKNVIVLLMFCFPILLSSQTRKTDIILEKTIGFLIILKYEASIALVENDTSFYFSLRYQNSEYSQIMDRVSVFIANEDDFKNLYNDLVSAYKILMKGEKVNLYWSSSRYKLSINEKFKTKVFLYNDEDKYTTINAEIIVSILKNMKNIDFGSYKLITKD